MKIKKLSPSSAILKEDVYEITIYKTVKDFNGNDVKVPHETITCTKSDVLKDKERYTNKIASIDAMLKELV